MPRSLCVGFIYTSHCLWRAFLSPTLGRARDAAIVRCWMSGISLYSVHRSCHAISLYSVHRSCDRLALRLAIVSLWGESDAIE